VLKSVTDPMSGFFALRRGAIDVAALQPRGFKILLEILARTGSLAASEVPFTFAERNDGESKASWREGVRYLRQLLALRLSTDTGLGRFARFGAIGASGVAVNLLALAALLHLGLTAARGGGEVLAAVLATQVAITWNFVLTERWVFPNRPRHWSARVLPFFALNNLARLAQLPLTARLVVLTGMSYVAATAVAIVALMALRYAVCDALLFRVRRVGSAA
jgi:dolichol-phosphate mannosyltransferase